MIRGACLRTAICVALFALVGFLCLTANAFASQATANANAEIIAPIAISATTDLDFGIVAFGPGAGTITIANDGSRSSGGSGVAVAGSPAAAEFAITGEGTYTYAITLPGSITITDGSHPMTVDSFTSNPDTTGTLSAGADTLLVGAKLHSAAGNQAAGNYTGTFNVIVVYN